MSVVKYVGLSGVRQISTKDWEQAGVKEQETVRWDKSNGYSVPIEKLSDAALKVIEPDRNFVILDSEKKGSGAEKKS